MRSTEQRNGKFIILERLWKNEKREKNRAESGFDVYGVFFGFESGPSGRVYPVRPIVDTKAYRPSDLAIHGSVWIRDRSRPKGAFAFMSRGCEDAGTN